MQSIESVEEFFLSLPFPFQELDIVDEQQVYLPVHAPEFGHRTGLNGADQLVGERVLVQESP